MDGFSVELTTAADAKEVKAESLPPFYRFDPELFITRLALLPRWKNSGSTPTKNMTIRVNAGAARFGLDPDGPHEPIYDYDRPAVSMMVGPGAVEHSDAIEIPGAGALIDWSFQPVGDAPLYLIWGNAIYEDVFGGKHFTDWCYKIRLERHDGKMLRAGFIQWGDHNRTDHDQQKAE